MIDTKCVKKVKEFISETVGASLGVDEELPISTEYYLWITNENGTGYNKNFDTGKPVNFYKTIPNNPLYLWDGGKGVDININDYGMGIQLGGDSHMSIHLKDSSIEFGHNCIGRIYVKHSYIDDNGVYVYNKFSLNSPEIVATIFLSIYAPNFILTGATGAALIAVF